MTKVLFGFLAGVAVTFASFMLIGNPFGRLPTAETVKDSSSRDETAPSGASSSRTETIAVESSLRSEENGSESTGPGPGVLPASEPPSFELVEEMDRRRDAARSAWIQADSDNWRTLAAMPVVEPIRLPPEFDWLTESPSIPHELIQREAIDPVWAGETEARLIGYFSDHPEITARFGFPTVHCRTTRCEIRVIKYDTDEGATMASLNWSRLNRPLFTLPWADEFGHGPNAQSPVLLYDVNTDNGVVTILWHIAKTPQPAVSE